ncbi:MAG: hypothetical protein COA78_00300 [Blastopirellula sp.]|nr:MAG: hypothetical protein COA78_00300 [Blastopirellula sp.]
MSWLDRKLGRAPRIAKRGRRLELAQGNAGRRGLAPILLSHAMQFGNPFNSFLGNGGPLRGKHIDKFTPYVDHAGHFRDFAFAVLDWQFGNVDNYGYYSPNMTNCCIEPTQIEINKSEFDQSFGVREG